MDDAVMPDEKRIYGVDINPMAADLAKVSLWLTAMTPGKPLSFLDHHIKVGNALLGITPALLRDGVPDAAFTAHTGDDKAEVTRWKKANKTDRANRGGDDLFSDRSADLDPTKARTITTEVDQALRTAASLDEVTFAAQRYATLEEDPETLRHRLAADAWCAAFLIEKTPTTVPITTAVVDAVAAGTADGTVLDAVRDIAARHRLFHWHLEFPEVFRIPEDGPAGDTYGWTGGFAATLGNPPWERVKLQEQEFFATRANDIANAKNAAARKKAISALENSERHALFVEFNGAKRRSEAESHFLRTSGRFPLAGVGDVNTYQVFSEHFLGTLGERGRMGIIVPTGIVTDATTQAFARAAIPRLAAVLDFRNTGFFEGVASAQGVRFCVLAINGRPVEEPAKLIFRATSVGDVQDPARTLQLLPSELVALNPNTGTLPIFLSRRDADLTLSCYQGHPVLIRDGGENQWNLNFVRLLDMATDSGLFRSADNCAELGATYNGWAWEKADQTWVPLYEAKMLHFYQHRHGTYEGYSLVDGKGVRSIPTPTPSQLDDPDYETTSRYWVDADAIHEAIPAWWDREWMLGWRDIATSLDQRTFIATALPLSAVGHVFPLAFPLDPTHGPLLQAVWSSMAFDYLARQKLSGTHMTYGVLKQMPVPTPASFDEPKPWTDRTLSEFVRTRVLELTYTSQRMAGYARDVMTLADGGLVGEPFRWIPERRAQLIGELDAAMLHVYGFSRAEAEHVLDSFPIVRRNEERDLGEYRTKRLVLAAYDALAEAAATGVPFVSPLDPPPGDGPRHPERER